MEQNEYQPEYEEEVARSEKLILYKPYCNFKGKFLNYWSVPFKSGERKGVWEMCSRKEPTPEKVQYGGVIIIGKSFLHFSCNFLVFQMAMNIDQSLYSII